MAIVLLGIGLDIALVCNVYSNRKYVYPSTFAVVPIIIIIIIIIIMSASSTAGSLPSGSIYQMIAVLVAVIGIVLIPCFNYMWFTQGIRHMCNGRCACFRGSTPIAFVCLWLTSFILTFTIPLTLTFAGRQYRWTPVLSNDINAKIMNRLLCPIYRSMQKSVGKSENHRVHPSADENDVAGEQQLQGHQQAANAANHQQGQEPLPLVNPTPQMVVLVPFAEGTKKVETQSSFCGELDKFLTSLDLGKHSSTLSEQEFDLTTVKSMSKQDLMDAGLPLGAATKIVNFREGGEKLDEVK